MTNKNFRLFQKKNNIWKEFFDTNAQIYLFLKNKTFRQCLTNKAILAIEYRIENNLYKAIFAEKHQIKEILSE